MAEQPSYKVLIAYRPFSIDDPALLQTVASDETIQIVHDSLAAAGFDAEIVCVGRDIETVLRGYDPRETLIFNYCDGFQDDPTGYDPVTRLFEDLGFAYTGARDAVLVSSQDKATIKAVLVAHDVPTPVYRICETAPEDWTHFPALVKPSRKHGSLGITPESVVETPEALARQVRRVVEEWQQPALVEEFIDGVEYRVSLWGNGHVETLPLMSITYFPIPGRQYGLKDFQTKWEEIGLKMDIPAQVEPALKRRIEETAIAAYHACEMRDYGGIDIRVRDDTPYVIDPNANADISDVSNFIRVAKAAGYDYSMMLARIVRLAAERIPR